MIKEVIKMQLTLFIFMKLKNNSKYIAQIFSHLDIIFKAKTFYK